MRIAVPDFVSSTHIALIAAKELGFFTDEGQEVATKFRSLWSESQIACCRGGRTQMGR
jgi:hypothetical protein